MDKGRLKNKKGGIVTIHRISIEFESLKGDKIILPKNFTYILQSFIYELGREKDLHKKFYKRGSKYYHLFVYSSLMGEHQYKDKKHVFEGPIRIEFSSPVSDFCMAVSYTLLNQSKFHIGNQEIKVKSIRSVEEPKFAEAMDVEALSPISVHKTTNIEGKRKTIYFSPFEKEFSELVKNNLLRKYEAFTKKNISNDAKFEIEPLQVSKKDLKILMYEKDKNHPFVIKGWTGKYRIKGDPELVKFAYRSGLGARNSQGFGFVNSVSS